LFLRILVPSLIPTQSGIDYAGHFGGAVAGGCIAGAFALWSAFDRHAAVRRAIGLAATIAYAASALFGGVRLVQLAPAFDRAAPRLPMDIESKLLGYSEAQARALVATYPLDPQARLALAVALYRADNPVAAETEAIAGLRQVRTYLGGMYGLTTTPELQVMIALSAADAEHDPRRFAAITPLCPMMSAEFRARVLMRSNGTSWCPL
jgi:membrane associated rhomboid family serine protease